MVKVCYFIQSHNNPEQVHRLAQVIKRSSANAHVLISHDFSTSYLDPFPLSVFSGIDVIRRDKPSIRGEFSLFQPYLDAIDWLFENNLDFDWLVYLSGQDYPVQPLSQIESFLAQTEYDAFMDHWDVLAKDNPWGPSKGLRRYFCQYRRLPEWTRWFFKKISKIQDFTPIQYHLGFGTHIGLKAKAHPFNEEFRCYGGLIWSTLSRGCVQFFRDYLQEHPELVQYYKRTILPEESLLASVLVNSHLFKISRDNKRYIDLNNPKGDETRECGAARVLSEQDYPIMLSGNYHFARKFDSQRDSKVLDLLDTKVLASKITTSDIPEVTTVK